MGCGVWRKQLLLEALWGAPHTRNATMRKNCRCLDKSRRMQATVRWIKLELLLLDGGRGLRKIRLFLLSLKKKKWVVPWATSINASFCERADYQTLQMALGRLTESTNVRDADWASLEKLMLYLCLFLFGWSSVTWGRPLQILVWYRYGRTEAVLGWLWLRAILSWMLWDRSSHTGSLVSIMTFPVDNALRTKGWSGIWPGSPLGIFWKFEAGLPCEVTA